MAKYNFVVVSKPAGCAYCEATKRFLASKGVEFSVLDYTDKAQYEQVHDLAQAAVVDLSTIRSVPMLFVQTEKKVEFYGSGSQALDVLQESWEDIILEATGGEAIEFVNPKA